MATDVPACLEGKVQDEEQRDQGGDENTGTEFTSDFLVDRSCGGGEVSRSTGDNEDTGDSCDKALVAEGTEECAGLVGGFGGEGEHVEATLDGELDVAEGGCGSRLGDDLDLTECGCSKDVDIDGLDVGVRGVWCGSSDDGEDESRVVGRGWASQQSARVEETAVDGSRNV